MKKSKASIITSYVVLIIASLIVLLPFIWMITSSFKSQRELFAFPPKLLPTVWKFSNYVQVLNSGSVSFFKMFMNSMTIAIPVTVCNILFSSLAAYAFARIKFPGRTLVFMLFISSMMVPGAIVLIPRFMMFTKLQFIDTYLPLMLPAMFGSAFSIFLLRQFFMTIPIELEEAAIIDGCGRFRIWSTIMIPLSKPIIATLAVFLFQGAYNDFQNPLIYINSSSKFTVQLGLAAFRSAFATRYDLIMAGSLLALIPVIVLYMVCQKYIVKGIVMTGLKG